MGDDAAQDRLTVERPIIPPECSWSKVLTRQVAVPRYLDLGHHRQLFFTFGTVWLYERESFHHGDEKECEALAVF